MFGIISGAICFAVVVIYSTWYNRHVKSQDEYLLAGRHTKLFPLIATLVMTEFNTGTLISFSSLGYSAGYWALTMPFIFLIGLGFYTLVVVKKWKQFNGISVAHFFALRYGRTLEVFVAVILFIAMLGFSATYIKSLTILILPLVPINPLLLSLALIILILLLTLKGGLTSIIALDKISFIFVIIFFPLLVYYAYLIPIETNTPKFNLFQMQSILPPKFIISLTILTMFSYIIAPWYGQKIISAKNTQTAYIGAAIATVIIFILYSLSILATAILKTKGIILNDPQTGLAYLIRYALPTQMLGIAYVILFFIAASTLAGVWNAMVTLVVGSILKNNNIKYDILIMLICALGSYILANTLIDNILNKMILFNIPIVAFSFALLGGFYWPRANTFGAYTSIIVGITWGIFCYCYFGENGLYTWYWATLGIPLIFICGIVTSLLTKKSNG